MRRASMALRLHTSMAALAALLLGCGGSRPPAQAPAAPPPPSSSRPLVPPPQATPPIETEDKLVRVSRPLGEGWTCEVERLVQQKLHVTVSFVQCNLVTPSGKMTLLAKDYQVPPDAVLSAEALSTVEYPKHYRKRYDDVRYTRSGPVDHRGQPGFEVEIDLSRDGGPVTHVIERVIVVGTHTLNVSATGPATTFPSQLVEVQRWIEGADFAVMRGDPLRQASL
ncbi:Hypothetical protein A7982_04118 [Minicystis rosea]|nr:Hypothetical protein A7982_04118 [Minicystis rosea]